MLLSTFVCLRKKVLWFWCLYIFDILIVVFHLPVIHKMIWKVVSSESLHRVLGSPNHLFWDTMILRVNIFDHISRVVKLWEWRVRFWSWFFLGQRFRQLTVGIHYIYIFIHLIFKRGHRYPQSPDFKGVTFSKPPFLVSILIFPRVWCG